MPPRYRFPKSHRLAGRGTFSAIFETGVKESRGPLLLVAAPNALDHLRLGISVPKRIGTAAVRNRFKRLLRESFRLMQHDFPGGMDLVVVVRPHEPMILAEYQKLLMRLIVSAKKKLDQRPQ